MKKTKTSNNLFLDSGGNLQSSQTDEKLNWMYPCIAPLFFLVFLIFINPWTFEFPLNDDWAYSLSVRHLLDTNKIILTDWASPTQIAHILWGGLFTKIFIFSFGVLRISTIVLSMATLVFFYFLVKEFEIENKIAALAALVLAFSPLYVLLSNTFMTDVPYLFWATLSNYFGVRYLKNNSSKYLWLSSLFAAIAYLTKQIGIFMPVSITIVLFFEKKLNLKTFFKIWSIPFMAVSGHFFWFNYVHGPTWASINYALTGTIKHISSFGKLWTDAFDRFFSSAIETGFFLFPIAAGFFFSIRQIYGKKSGKWLKASGQKGETGMKNLLRLSIGMIIILIIYVSFKGFIPGHPFQNSQTSGQPLMWLGRLSLLPYLENSFGKTGFGPLTVGGSSFKFSGFFSEDWFWQAATIFGIVSGGMLLATTSAACFNWTRRGAMAHQALKFIFYGTAVQFLLLLAGAKFFDRYLIVMFEWFLLSVIIMTKDFKFSKFGVILGLIFILGLDWAGLKDYFSWNNAKWEITKITSNYGIQQEEIANGFDYNAWFHYEKNMKLLKSIKPLKMIGEWEWQKSEFMKTRAMVSFQEVEGFETIAKLEYKTPLSKKPGTLYLIKYY